MIRVASAKAISQNRVSLQKFWPVPSPTTVTSSCLCSCISYKKKPAQYENITRCLSATVVYWVLIELINLFVLVSTHRPKSFHNIKTISASIGKLLRKDYSVWILCIFVTSYTGKRVYQVPPGKYDSDHVPRATCSRCPFTHKIVITCMLTMLVIVCCSTYRNNFLVITCDSNGFHTCM